jgi:hypothetical protein
MHTEEILHELTKPFIIAGIYKDEKSALTDITLDYVCRKIEKYDNIISSFKKNIDVILINFPRKLKIMHHLRLRMTGWNGKAP